MTEQNHPQGAVLQAYFDQELVAGEAAQVSAHVENCPECRQALAELAEVQTMLAKEATIPAPPPAWPSIAAELNQEKSRRFGPMFACGTAAACAAGIFLGLLVGESEIDNSQNVADASEVNADYLWSGFEESSILDVYANFQETEGTEGS